MNGATTGTGPSPETFAALRAQLQEAATALADGPGALEGILLGMVDDIDRAVREPLEIFPVCHHSPASATAMARRLREKQPKVVYLELCEDMAPLLTELRNCTLPVAVQAFATEVDGFPVEWSPLSVVAPITEASAEYQAIAYALDTPGAELVLVDRSSDHVFQWDTRRAHQDTPDAARPPEEDTALHGDAVGVQIGDLRPRFAELEEHLLRHGRVRHWSEWWHQYVELPLGDSDHDTYRQVMFLIGSLFRRLAPGDPHQVRVDEDRERYMWTRMREHLAATGTAPADCLYVCGAFHAASRVAEFGAARRRRLRDQPAHGHHLAARPDPVQPRGDRSAVRPGRGIGVDRRDGLGEERQAHRRQAVPAGGAGGQEEALGQEGCRRPRSDSGSGCGQHRQAVRLPPAAAGPG